MINKANASEYANAGAANTQEKRPKPAFTASREWVRQMNAHIRLWAPGRSGTSGTDAKEKPSGRKHPG